jgi:dienelactone hydrolase
MQRAIFKREKTCNKELLNQEVTLIIENIPYGQTLLGQMAYKKTNKKIPAVLVAHAWGGRDEFACKKAQMLAELGYLGFALDMYGDAKTGSNTEENSNLMGPLIADRVLLRDRILAAFEKVKTLPMVDPTKIGAIGFCFGGLCVLDLARSGADLKGVVSFHGLLNKPQIPAKNPIKAKILALHGHDDPMVNPTHTQDFMNEMTKALADWQIHIYGNTMHAFTNPQANDKSFGTVYNEKAADRSFKSMKNFFEQVFS